jgi:hypothetical protein
LAIAEILAGLQIGKVLPFDQRLAPAHDRRACKVDAGKGDAVVFHFASGMKADGEANRKLSVWDLLHKGLRVGESDERVCRADAAALDDERSDLDRPERNRVCARRSGLERGGGCDGKSGLKGFLEYV